MLIVEKLYLLMANDAQKPEAVASTTGYGMNAAVIADLMVAGRVNLSENEPKRIQLIGAGPCPDPVLAGPLNKLEKKEGLPLDEAVKISGLCEIRLVTDSLAKAGIVAYGKKTLLGLGKARVQIINEQIQQQIKKDLQAALQGQKNLTASDTTALAILQAVGLTRVILDEELTQLPASKVQERIQELIQQSPVADSAQRAVASLSTVITAAGI